MDIITIVIAYAVEEYEQKGEEDVYLVDWQRVRYNYRITPEECATIGLIFDQCLIYVGVQFIQGIDEYIHL